jgi:S1-C subfamily serine protease
MRKTFTLVVFLLVLVACRREEKPKQPPTPLPPPKASSTEPRASVSSTASYADAVERASPGVVSIRAERRGRAPQQHPFFNDPMLRDFFGLFGGNQPGGPRVQAALGSGVIVQPDGVILTNHHVIDGAQQIKVELSNHRIFDAKVLGSDPPSDLAVLKIESKDLAALSLADSDRVRVGDIALAVGNPLGIGQTVTAGIISAKGRSTGLSDGSFEDFLQTDAPINQHARRAHRHQFTNSIAVRRQYRNRLRHSFEYGADRDGSVDQKRQGETRPARCCDSTDDARAGVEAWSGRGAWGGHRCRGGEQSGGASGNSPG